MTPSHDDSPSTITPSHTTSHNPPPVINDITDYFTHGGPDAKAHLLSYVEEQLALPPHDPFLPKESPLVEFWTTAQFRDYDVPKDHILVGDYHVQRGLPFVVAGAPGTGKSRAIVALARAGAQGVGAEWFGLPVKHQFRTMILQCENGPVRLSQELQDIPLDDAGADPMADWVRISPPPPMGFRFDTPKFLAQLSKAIDEFQPHLFVLDPWTRLAEDDKAADYRRAFDRLLGVLPSDEASRPAIGIVAHTRKPKPEERANGRALIHVVSGSFVLVAAARSVFVMQHASDRTEETNVVMTCCKNNDGKLGSRSAWERKNGIFLPVHEFDWGKFDGGEKTAPQKSITSTVLAKVFADGPLSRGDAVNRLMQVADIGKTVAYRALQLDGEFKNYLSQAGGLLIYEDPFESGGE